MYLEVFYRQGDGVITRLGDIYASGERNFARIDEITKQAEHFLYFNARLSVWQSLTAHLASENLSYNSFIFKLKDYDLANTQYKLQAITIKDRNTINIKAMSEL